MNNKHRVTTENGKIHKWGRGGGEGGFTQAHEKIQIIKEVCNLLLLKNLKNIFKQLLHIL